MLNWKGKQVKQKMVLAQITGIDIVLKASVIQAKLNHTWINRTGKLEGSVGVYEFARRVIAGVRGVWGSRKIVYAIFQEIGTSKMPARPFLRPAADVQYPKLAGHIRRAMSL